MGQVINIFSRLISGKDPKMQSNSYDGQFIEYDPQMLVATEIFVDLDKSVLLDGCWVPLNWDESGIVVLVDDLSDIEKQAAIQTALKTEKIILGIGTKEDIEAIINRSFSELEMHEFLSKAMSGEDPTDVTKLVDIIITEAYTKGVSEIYYEWSESFGKNRVFFWMEGVYQEYMTVAETVAYDVVKRIKSMANLDVYERELAKVGHFNFSCHEIPEIPITVITYPIGGLREDVVLKILTV